MSNEQAESTAAITVSEHRSDVQVTAFASESAFIAAQRMARALASSTMVPVTYRIKDEKGNDNPAAMGNCLIALEASQRIGASPLAVMQNMHIIQGRPSWAASFIIAALNSCGRLSPLRWTKVDLGDKEIEYTTTVWEGNQKRREKRKIKIRDRGFTAWAYDKSTGEKLEGPQVTLEMAVHEGWYTKADSKWTTMPEQMGMLRSAAFFGRLYAPDVLVGMHATEEVEDIATPAPAPRRVAPASNLNETLGIQPEAKPAPAASESAKGEPAAPTKPLEQGSASHDASANGDTTKVAGDDDVF